MLGAAVCGDVGCSCVLYCHPVTPEGFRRDVQAEGSLHVPRKKKTVVTSG